MAPLSLSKGITYEVQKNNFAFQFGTKYFLKKTSVINTGIMRYFRFHSNTLTRFGILGGVKYITSDHKNFNTFIKINAQYSTFYFGEKTFLNGIYDFHAENAIKSNLLDLAFLYGASFKVLKNIFLITEVGFQTGYKKNSNTKIKRARMYEPTHFTNQYHYLRRDPYFISFSIAHYFF